MSLILLVSPVFNVEISEAVCYFVIKNFFFGKVKSLFPMGRGVLEMMWKNFTFPHRFQQWKQ